MILFAAMVYSPDCRKAPPGMPRDNLSFTTGETACRQESDHGMGNMAGTPPKDLFPEPVH